MRNFYFITMLVLSSCSAREYLSPEELETYILNEENQLKKTVEVSGYKIEVVYRPTDLFVHQEIGEEPVDIKPLDHLRTKYNSNYYFIVSLSKNEKEALQEVEGGMDQYSSLVQTLSFRMGQFANLTTSLHDTIPVADAMLNRTYGMSKTTDILFAFSKTGASKSDWIQFNLNEFGLGIGNQRFRFKCADLENVPQINFEIKNSN